MLRKLACLTAMAAGLSAQPAGAGVIAGVVVDHATGSPVRKAIVNVMWQGTPQAWATQQTDGSGRFQVDGLPPGSFTISANKEGAGTGWWSDTPGTTGKMLPLANGERRTDLVIRLIRPMVITGTVTDADGEPLMNADVQMFREGWPRGGRELMQIGSARTNDRGEYRLNAMFAGKFYLAATAADRRMSIGIPGEPALTFARQFHGGASDYKKSTPLVMKSGQQLQGMNFRLEEQRMGSVRGHITNPPPMPEPPSPNSPPARPPQHVMIQASMDEARQARHFYGGGMNPMDGTFQIPALPPGTYLLTATMQGGERALWATQRVDVKGDVEGVSLTLAPAISIRGKVTFEGGSPSLSSPVSVDLTSPLGRGTGPGALHATPAADGTFVFEQVPPGVWDINVRPIPKGGYIKSMRLGEQDVLTEEMEIGLKPAAALNIVVSSRGGTVSGQLAEDAGKSYRGMVVLAPEEKFRHVMSFYAMSATKAEGKFEMTGVTPGKYRAYALEMTTGPMDLRDPELLARLASESVAVDVPEGGSVQITPTLIRAARLQEVSAQ